MCKTPKPPPAPIVRPIAPPPQVTTEQSAPADANRQEGGDGYGSKRRGIAKLRINPVQTGSSKKTGIQA
jgi:hypothetical protein